MKKRYNVLLLLLSILYISGDVFSDIKTVVLLNGQLTTVSAIRMESPPEIYRQWWKEVSDCAGTKVDFKRFERISWYIVGTDYVAVPFNKVEVFSCLFNSFCYGVWMSGGKIYIAGSKIHNERIVKHELLHHLLDEFNIDYFLTKKHHRLFYNCHL